jgi:hypothetical protein
MDDVKLEQMEWHREVADFGQVDGDITLLSKIVEKIVIPIIISRIPLYDPYSLLDTTRGMNLLSQLSDYLSMKSASIVNLLASLKDHFKRIVAIVLKRQGDSNRKADSSSSKQFWLEEQFKVLRSNLSYSLTL